MPLVNHLTDAGSFNKLNTLLFELKLVNIVRQSHKVLTVAVHVASRHRFGSLYKITIAVSTETRSVTILSGVG